MTTTTITISAKSWDEERAAEIEGPHAIAQARFTTEWSGEIAGTSTCWLLISYVDGDPGDPHSLVGPYTGFELVDATVDGHRGTFVLAASGDHRDGVARTDVRVVRGSGTRQLAGITGSGHYVADAMEYKLELDYQL
ncbi:MAG TPA: DUF3224 domain-containing protein [Jatrophihabitantaceae bacterium]|jgi:hypothetical protein